MSHHSTGHAGQDPNAHHDHVSPVSMYMKVFGALLVLTVVTVGVSYADLGPASIYVAMFVALIKASLVCAFFMHLKWDEKLNVMVFLSSLVFMSIFFLLTAADLGYRGVVIPEQDNFVLTDEQQGIRDLADLEVLKEAAKAAAAKAAIQGAAPKVAPSQVPARAPAPAPGPGALDPAPNRVPTPRR